MDTPEQEALLQRYVDGDLDAADRAQMQERLAKDPALAKELAAMQKLHEILVTAGEYQASQLDSEALFARISAATEAELEAKPQRATQSESLWHRFLHGFWMPAGSVVAVAAAVLLTIYLPVDNTKLDKADEGTKAAAPEGQSQEPTPQVQSKEGPAARRVEAPRTSVSSEVVQVDFGNNAGTVFDIALAGGASTPVVWINDEEE